jgi:hypothetical protein
MINALFQNKVLEKIAYRQCYNHLDDNNRIYKHQYGFRSKHSTQSLLIKLQNVLFKAKSRKKKVLAIYVDIKKAFDCVNHKILLDKIEHYKLPRKWFESYLKQRRQYTCVGGVKSSLLDVIYGVAQGSIIGPLLFLLMINDLPFASEFMSLLYADDTSFLIEADDIQTLYQKANKQLASAESWFLDNRLTLHPSKTRYMVYSKVDSMPDTLQLSMLGHQIIRVCENGPEKTFKLVGVHID